MFKALKRELKLKSKVTHAKILQVKPDQDLSVFSSSVYFRGQFLQAVRVIESEARFADFNVSNSGFIQEVDVPGGNSRDAFLKKWVKAAKKNKKGLMPILLLPLAACGGGETPVLESYDGTIAGAKALDLTKYASTFTVKVSDSGSVDAADLNSIATNTTGKVTSASVTAVAGTSEEVQAALDDAQLVSLDAIDVTISDTGALAATVLTTLAGATTGDVTSAGVTSITGDASQAQAALGNAQLVSLDAIDVTISDTGAVAATVLTNLAGATTGDVTSAGVTSITGDASQAQAALGNAQLVSLDAIDVTISDTGAVAATVLTNLAGATTGDVTSAGVTSITGDADAIQAAVTDSQLVSLGSVNVVVSGTSTAI